jgi:hypothetical protein
MEEPSENRRYEWVNVRTPGPENQAAFAVAFAVGFDVPGPLVPSASAGQGVSPEASAN